MYGGASKLGRGGGGGGRGGGVNKRLSFPPPPHRPTVPSTGRLSLGGTSSVPRNRPSGPTGISPATEENFSLVPGQNPLAFAMIIRLAPDLVEEIRRVEAQDGAARIKFDVNPNHPSENVIDVAGKAFKFTWSREFGDLCDIYEERHGGEDGNGLLVESGSAWRKLNVQRILDESTTNHVKMRSEEAERKLKSRKAIVLDHGNPSMKSQIKALAAVEANPRMMHYKQKKEPPFKKRKVEPPQVVVGGPPKSAQKSGLTSAISAKGRLSASPVPSPPEQFGVPASPFGTANTTKNNVNFVEVIPTQVTNKENASNFEKETPTRVGRAVRETPGKKRNFGAKPTDLPSMLISLLMENPKGMSLKALEKAVGDTIPNSIKKIEPIIKKIATFQAPGRYVLKSEVELESFKKPLSESGSSPEDNRDQTLGPETRFEVKDLTDSLEEQALMNSKDEKELNISEGIDIKQQSPNLFGEKKGSDITEGQAESSSDSGSDSESESDSSDSGSDSGSKSPVGSGSASSSDSESDGSPNNSKEGSDEDVDIMSDDDKEPKHILPTSEIAPSKSPLPWRTPEGISMQDKIDEKHDDHESDVVEIETDLPDINKEIEIAAVCDSIPNKEYEKTSEETKRLLPDGDNFLERQKYVGDLFGENVKESFRHEQFDSSERVADAKSKRSSYPKHIDENPERTKRLKADNLAQTSISGIRDAQLESPHNFSPDRLVDNHYKGAAQMMIRANRDGNADFGLLKRHNPEYSGKFTSDFVQSGMRSFDQSVQAKVPDMAERDRPDKYPQKLGSGNKYSEKSLHAQEDFSMQKDKAYRDTEDEDGGAGGKHTVPSESHYSKHGEMVGKFKEVRHVSSSRIGSPPNDNSRSGMERSALVNRRGRTLQRELSDLELGELREPLTEEPSGETKFERKSSFKQLEGKVIISDTRNSDVSRGKPVGKATLDSGGPSPPNVSARVTSNLEASNKKITPEHHVENLARSNQKVMQHQPQHLSRVDRADFGSQLNKLVDRSSKSRYSEDASSQGIGLEGFGESQKKVAVSAPPQHDMNRELVSRPVKESKRKKSNSVVGLTDVQKDTIVAERNNSGQKRRDSSSDENSCSYSKYEKDKPEIRGPIKDFSQYKEYVQEYRDKYDSYRSLNNILEGYRNQFHELEKDLEYTKSRDMDRYYNILSHLKESYRQCGTKHKRLRKIFAVLHDELQNLKQRIKDYALSY